MNKAYNVVCCLSVGIVTVIDSKHCLMVRTLF